MRGPQGRAGGRKSTGNTTAGDLQNEAGSATRGCANGSRRRQECDSMKQYQEDEEKEVWEAENKRFRCAKVGKALRRSSKNHGSAQLSNCAAGDMAKALQRRRQRSQRGTLEGSQTLKNRCRHAPHQQLHTGERENARL